MLDPARLAEVLNRVYGTGRLPYARDGELVAGLAWDLHYRRRAGPPRLLRTTYGWRAEVLVDGRPASAMHADRETALGYALALAAGEDPEEEGLSTEEAAEYLGLTRNYLRVLVANGKLPARTVSSGELRFLVSDLDRVELRRSRARERAWRCEEKERQRCRR